VNIPRDHIRRILCIKPRGIGDIVLSTIVLENLASAFPGARVDYLVEEFARPAVQYHPLVSGVLTMAPREFVLSVAFRVRRERYDLLLDFWSNPRTAQISLLSGVRHRVGYGYRGRRYAYTIRGTSTRGDHHAAEHNLELLRALGIPIVSRRIAWHVTEEMKRRAQTWLRETWPEQKPVVGIVPSGGWPSKRCDVTTWAAICRELGRTYACRFLVLWGPGDEKDARGLRDMLGDAVTLAPPTGVAELGGFLQECAVVIANDSGPMHIAAAIGVPTIGIFGPTDPARHGPYGPSCGTVSKADLHCIICNKLECPYGHECMKQLSIEDLLAQVETLAGKRLHS
jgi:ADP-heptose:LPS heptosyltransferase